MQWRRPLGHACPTLACVQPLAMLKPQQRRLPVLVQDERPASSSGRLLGSFKAFVLPLPVPLRGFLGGVGACSWLPEDSDERFCDPPSRGSKWKMTLGSVSRRDHKLSSGMAPAASLPRPSGVNSARCESQRWSRGAGQLSRP